MSNESFNPNDYMMTLQGKPYLPVAPRLAWANDDHQEGRFPIASEIGTLEIRTQLLHYGSFDCFDKMGKPSTDWEAVVHATVEIYDKEGTLLTKTNGFKRETKQGFADFVEKAETGAIGRAFAAAGYGTIQSQDFEEGLKESPIDGKVGPAVVDAPQPSKPATKAAATASPKRSGRPAKVPASSSTPKVAVPTYPDPLSVVAGTEVNLEELFRGPTPTTETEEDQAAREKNEARRKEQLEWLSQHVDNPTLASLMHESIKTHKVPKVSNLDSNQVHELYEAATALLAA